MDKRFKGLDVLRLCAVLIVLLFHYAYRGAVGDEGFTRLSIPDWHPVAKYGYLGVHLFFVISGVVIARSTEGRGPIAFLLARFQRIYPAFLVCMTITFAVTTLFGAPQFTASPKMWAANLLVFSPLLRQPFMDGAYWSIVYEIIFYGWVLLLLNRRLFDRHGTALALAWIALSVGNEYLGPSLAVRRLFLTDASGFFLCGITIYRLQARGRSLQNWVVLALSAELAAGQAIITSRYNVIHYGADLSTGVIVAIALGSVLIVGLSTLLRRDILPTAVAVAVGGLTYPLYLLHQNIGYIAFDRLDGMMSPERLVLGTAAVMVVVALVIHRAVERPLQACLRRVMEAADLERLPGILLRSRTVRAPETDHG